MTLGRRDREPVGRDPLDRGSNERMSGNGPGWRSVEVEELPAQRVATSARRRPPIGALLAVACLVILLATGLGALGGRDVAKRSSSPAAALASVSSTVPPSAVAIAATPAIVPAVTPFAPCGADPAVPPNVFLEFERNSSAGVIEGVEWRDPTSAPSASTLPVATGERIEIRADANASLGIDGNACAVSWRIYLVDEVQTINLETRLNGARDPHLAEQDKFSLRLSRFRGADYDLEAHLTFPDFIEHVRWLIRILPFDLPEIRLSTKTRDLDLVPGCNLQLSLANGYREAVNRCGGAAGYAPRVASVAAGTRLTFRFPQDWDLLSADPRCGTVDQTLGTFAEDATATCAPNHSTTSEHFTFDAPTRPQQSTVAITACGTYVVPAGVDELCGTWYATIKVAA